MNSNFAEMLRALSDAGADFLIVGAHARAAYGEPRATKDIDIWVRPVGRPHDLVDADHVERSPID